MKKSYTTGFIIVSICILSVTFFSGCRKSKNPIKYAMGTFPDSIVVNIEGLNSQFDDYNSTLYILGSTIPIIFSSNRGSSGGQFDLVQGQISFQFDQTTGAFQMGGEMTNGYFFTSLLNKANTSGNDLGPYSLLSSLEGYEYLIVASQNAGGPLDLYYLKHIPYFGTNNPNIAGPFPITLLNSAGNDAYLSFNSRQDTVYFSSDRDGNYDIYLQQKPSGTSIDTWFNGDYVASEKVDSVNSPGRDICPFVYKNIMVFASDRDGGLGGYDLYYSLFKNGKWSSPVNFGPDINTSSDEFRPVVGFSPDFVNNFIIFSSNREGGKGGYDLYFTGFNFSK
jgi:hypothetical protein